MTKLIAALAILAALAWAVTAVASWITQKKAPLAIASGLASKQVTAGEQNKAMVRAQLRAVAALAFALVMFAALFRVSIGLTGQAGLTIALTAGLSASGGLLLFSTLPAAKLSAGNPQPLTAKRTVVLPLAALLAYLVFLAVSAQAATAFPAWQDGIPLALVVLTFTGSAVLTLRRLSTTVAIPDPRMAALDRQWREVCARLLTHFTSGALLTYFGGTAIATGQALLAGASLFHPSWGIASLTAGAALALAGVVLVALAAKGALTIRATVLKDATAREESPAPITA